MSVSSRTLGVSKFSAPAQQVTDPQKCQSVLSHLTTLVSAELEVWQVSFHFKFKAVASESLRWMKESKQDLKSPIALRWCSYHTLVAALMVFVSAPVSFPNL